MKAKIAAPYQATLFGSEGARSHPWVATPRHAANSPLRPIWPSHSLEDSWHAAQDLWLRVARFTTVHRSGHDEVKLIFTLNPRPWTAAQREEWILLHSRLIDEGFYTAWHDGRPVKWVKDIEALAPNRWCIRVRSARGLAALVSGEGLLV